MKLKFIAERFSGQEWNREYKLRGGFGFFSLFRLEINEFILRNFLFLFFSLAFRMIKVTGLSEYLNIILHRRVRF